MTHSTPNRFVQLIRKLYCGLFPKPIQLSARDQQLLQRMYPSIEWKQVHFYQGMPWYMLHTFAIATVLPASYRTNRQHIYFRNYIAGDFECLLTLIHEAYHVLQYQEMCKNRLPGLGFFQRFIWHYMGWYFALFFGNLRQHKVSKAAYLAYRHHPLEQPAYGIEATFAKSFVYLPHGLADWPDFFAAQPQLVCPESGYGTTRPPWWALLLSFLITIIILLTKPLLELLLLVFLLPFLPLLWQKKKLNIPKDPEP